MAKSSKKVGAKGKDGDQLTAQQLRFVDEYVVDRNGTQAAIRAGYSQKTANEQAARLLAKVSIQKLINEKLKDLSEKTGITAERVLQEVGRVALADVRRAFNPNGALKQVHELDDDIAACIASVDVDVIYAGSGKDRVEIGYTQKVKFFNKNDAAANLMRHLGLFKEDNRQKADPVTELLAHINSRNSKLPIKP